MKVSEILHEGGNAMATANVRRIQRSEVPSTIKYVSAVSGIPVKDLHPLGSTGSDTPTSGDVDLAVDINKYDMDVVHNRIIDRVGDEYATLNKGLKTGSYAFDIGGDPSAGKVQVDLMYVPDTRYASFSYHSPGTKSKYKGAVRAILISAAAASLADDSRDYIIHDEKDGSLIGRVSRGLDMNKGLRTMFQMRPRKKGTDERVKTMKAVTPEEIEAEFPNVKITDDHRITVRDPDEIAEILFGKGITPADISSPEQILEIAKKRFTPERYELFKKIASGRMQQLKSKMDVPEI